MHMGKSSLSLNKHFAALGAAAAAVTGVGVAHQADAAIVYSGPVNLNVPSTTSGIYLNVQTGVSGVTPASAPGWDLNPWSSSSFQVWTNNASNPANSDGTVVNFTGGSSATLTDNLPAGTLIDNSWTYARTAGTETTGATAMQLNGTPNLVGFKFFNEATQAVDFGWARFTLSTTPQGQPRTLVDYAYENTGAGIKAGDTGNNAPEPTSLGLLALGAVGLMRRRK
jgi:hypothetical protein